MTCHHVWHMTGCCRQQHDECHLWNRTLFPYLPSWAFVSNSSCNEAQTSFLMWTIVCLLLSLSLSLSLSLTFVLRYVGSGYTNVVFRLSLYLLGLKLSLYLVRILYFVVICFLIRLHQSNQVHSTTWQALLNCKYQFLSIYPCCSSQNMNIVNDTFLYLASLCEMWLWKENI
jgi:hypothetical protein